MFLPTKNWLVIIGQYQHTPFFHLFSLIRTSVDCMMPICIRWGWGDLLGSASQFTRSDTYLFQKHPHTDTPRNNILPALWASLSPVRLTHKNNHHNVQSVQCQPKKVAWPWYPFLLRFCYTGVTDRMTGHVAELSLQPPSSLEVRFVSP